MRPAITSSLPLAILGLISLVMGHFKLVSDNGYDPRTVDSGLFYLVVGILLVSCAAMQWHRAARDARRDRPADSRRR